MVRGRLYRPASKVLGKRDDSAGVQGLEEVLLREGGGGPIGGTQGSIAGLAGSLIVDSPPYTLPRFASWTNGAASPNVDDSLRPHVFVSRFPVLSTEHAHRHCYSPIRSDLLFALAYSRDATVRDCRTCASFDIADGWPKLFP